MHPPGCLAGNRKTLTMACYAKLLQFFPYAQC